MLGEARMRHQANALEVCARPLATGVLALAVLIAVLPIAARGAELPDEKIEIGDLDLRSLLDLSVESVTRRPGLASQAPATVFVMTGRDLRSHGFRTLAEALAYVPGLFAHPGYYPQIGVRGMGVLGDFTSRLLALVDGHPIANPLGSDLGRGFPVPLSAVERIEVIKGPVGSVYGPSAFLGVINVVTKSASMGGQAWAGTEGAQGRLLGGEVTAAWRGRAGEADVLAAADIHWSRGLDWTYPDADGATAPVTVVGQDAERAQAGYGRVEWRDATLAAGCGNVERHLPGFAAKPFMGAMSVSGPTCFAEASWKQRLSDQMTLRVRGAFDHFGTSGTLPFPPPPLAVGPYTATGHDDVPSGELRVEWRPGELLLLDGGVAGQLHDLSQSSRLPLAPQYDDSSRTRFHTLHAWLQADLHPLRTLTLHGGVTAFSHSIFGAQVAPKLAAVWQPGPRDTLKAMWSTGFRPPNFIEGLLADKVLYQANRDLDPERVVSLELAYERRLGEVAALSASLFQNDYRKIIRNVPVDVSPGLERTQGRNLDDVAVLGGELSLTVRWQDWLQGWAGLSLQRSDQEHRPNFPQATGSFALSTRAPWKPLLLAVRGAASSARWNDPTRPIADPPPKVPASLSLGASATLDVPGVPGLGLEVGVRNLLDGRNASPSSFDTGDIPDQPEAARTVWADARWSF
jgi:outer membrane receptor protein involved in Fe transport